MAIQEIVPDQTTDDPSIHGAHEQTVVSSMRPKGGTVIWVVVLVASVAYIAFGSITTRSWRLDAFQQAWVQDISPRRVAHVWSYQFTHLPSLSSESLLKFGFGASVVIMVVGACAGLWLILHGSWETTVPEDLDAVTGSEAS